MESEEQKASREANEKINSINQLISDREEEIRKLKLELKDINFLQMINKSITKIVLSICNDADYTPLQTEIDLRCVTTYINQVIVEK